MQTVLLVVVYAAAAATALRVRRELAFPSDLVVASACCATETFNKKQNNELQIPLTVSIYRSSNATAATLVCYHVRQLLLINRPVT